MKATKLGKLFSQSDINRALDILSRHNRDSSAVAEIETRLVLPRIDHINFVTGQDNLPAYFAWVLVHYLRK